ncbi:cysteine desulfurase sulfur acceptor subunit CsdE [Klebsiella quasipneumoniae]|uniref:cysteine desulfurase sulfur acceptor subunit CsdE n=1 Tax=Klebsiella quasipneumoniae TaxID=1463165 RepID=UPI0034D351AD
MTTLHPFGTTITDATLRQTFAPLNQWEDKYRQLILLGKKLPTLTDERKAQAHEIAGCENRVWLGYEEDAEGRLHFFGDSEGRIVRGLLAVLLTAVEGKTRAGILAQIALAELHLEFTEVRAPFNGVVVALKTTIGQYASALKPVFTLLDDDRWYVIANFRETDLNNVHPGVAARITVMTNHNRTFNGVVDSVGSGVLPEGGSVIEGLPLIQKSINWVHVSQRFPVKIAVSDPDPELFRMGASASAVLQP